MCLWWLIVRRVRTATVRTRLAALLSVPAMVVLGEASYALYIVHIHIPLRDWMT